MRNHNSYLAIVIGILILLGGCTSKKVDQENPENADVSAEMTEGAGDSTADKESAPKEKGADEVSALEDDFGSDEPATAAATTDSGNVEAAGLEDLPADDGSSKTESPQDLATADSTDAASSIPTEAPPEENLAANETSSNPDETQGLSEPPVDRPIVPLKKMETTPYEKSGILVNAIYIARKGDSLKSVSQKVYGQDKVKELKKINPNLAKRDLKVGDKVYYNSPQRPTDKSQILTYYEDASLAPEVYLAKPGDNIRTVAKNLLGDSNSWKEIWSTNLEVESKDSLSEGTRLRYWSSETSAAAPPVIASNSTSPPPDAAVPAPPPMPDQAPPPPAMDANAPPPPPAMDANNTPPPPPPAMDTNNTPPPPTAAAMNEPPPPAEPPPPPEPVAHPKAEKSNDLLSSITGGNDPDQLMALGVGAILLLAAVALFIILRKKKAQREIDFQTATHTQID